MGTVGAAVGARDLSADLLRELKRAGFGDADLATLLGVSEESIRAQRQDAGIVPAYKRIDTCAAEFESFTPYMYGTFERECEAEPDARSRRSSSSAAARTASARASSSTTAAVTPPSRSASEGYETVMINCNPETVSTDYDTVDRLYFEPLTFEDVLAIIEREKSNGGDVACVVQYGGQTPLKLALPLQAAGVRILGTSPDSIDLAEDRERFAKLLWDLGIPQAASGTATSPDEARAVATEIGFPVVVRPSYVLGGRAMAIVYDMAALDRYMRHAVQASPEHPILIDKFLEDATEIDVDALADASGRGRHRRHHGAHRAGRHPLRRQFVRRAAVQAERQAHRDDSRLHAAHRPGPERRRPDERAVRRQGRRGVRARGESARVAHGAVPVEGHRRAAREGRRAADDRPDAGRAGTDRGSRRSRASS